MSEDFKSWNKDDFLGFILIDASFADELIQENEKAIITQILPIDRFYQLLEFYRFNTVEENRNIILSLKNKFYNTKEDNEELRAYIKRIFLSDGQFSLREKALEKSFDELFA